MAFAFFSSLTSRNAVRVIGLETQEREREGEGEQRTYQFRLELLDQLRSVLPPQLLDRLEHMSRRNSLVRPLRRRIMRACRGRTVSAEQSERKEEAYRAAR